MNRLNYLTEKLKDQLIAGMKINTRVPPFTIPEAARNLSSCVQRLEERGLHIDREETPKGRGSVLYYCTPDSIRCFQSTQCREGMISKYRKRIAARKTMSSIRHLLNAIELGNNAALNSGALNQLHEAMVRYKQTSASRQ